VVVIVPCVAGLVARHAVMPSAVARVAGAGACLAWSDPRSRGGSTYEVHLRVPASKVSRAETYIQVLLAGAHIKTVALGAFRFQQLIRDCDAVWVGASVLIDQLSADTYKGLGASHRSRRSTISLPELTTIKS
jgi:hypothetical protein